MNQSTSTTTHDAIFANERAERGVESGGRPPEPGHKRSTSGDDTPPDPEQRKGKPKPKDETI